MEAVFIMGLDALATKDHVVATMAERLGPMAGTAFRISKLRQNINRTQTATVTIGQTEAVKLTRVGKLRVGIIMCRVEKRVEVIRCYRCCEYRYWAANCSSEMNRLDLCYKCSQPGYKRKESTKKEACPICKKEGHKADSGQCPYFRLQRLQPPAKQIDH